MCDYIQQSRLLRDSLIRRALCVEKSTNRAAGKLRPKQAAELRIAAPADIDTAVELGLNYPRGPLALGDMLGGRRVLAVLDGMHAVTRDPKYRATAWLRRRALLGISLLTPD